MARRLLRAFSTVTSGASNSAAMSWSWLRTRSMPAFTLRSSRSFDAMLPNDFDSVLTFPGLYSLGASCLMAFVAAVQKAEPAPRTSSVDSAILDEAVVSVVPVSFT
eukprot:11187948-Lingulodinium_polyedra.AAC.1